MWFCFSFILDLRFIALRFPLLAVLRSRNELKNPWTAKKSKPGPKKTKTEFAERKKKNLTDSVKKSFEQIELPVATLFYVLFPRIFFLDFPFLLHAQVQQRECTWQSHLLAVNGRGAIISLAGGISCWQNGVTCLQIFKWQKLAIVYHQNVISLNELIGYCRVDGF